MTKLALAVVVAGAFAASQGIHAQSTYGQSQTQTTSGTAQSGNQELYHVHIVKAAPGRVLDLIREYVSNQAQTGVADRSLILRHIEGDDWDLVVINALGKQDTLTAVPSQQDMTFAQRTRPLRARHSDTFASGTPWNETRMALLGDTSNQFNANPTPTATSGSTSGTATSAPTDRTVYVVTTMMALPGHRDQLWQVMQRISNLTPGRTINLQHVEGAAWDFMSVTRYDSISDIDNNDLPGMQDRLRAQGFSGPSGPATELREHLAEHHDTIALRITSVPK